jgi:hypothetical protein
MLANLFFLAHCKALLLLSVRSEGARCCVNDLSLRHTSTHTLDHLPLVPRRAPYPSIMDDSHRRILFTADKRLCFIFWYRTEIG